MRTKPHRSAVAHRRRSFGMSHLVIGAAAGLCAVGLWAADTPKVDEHMPEYGEEIFVLGDAALVERIEPGEAVYVTFGVGELDVEPTSGAELRAFVEVDCRQVKRQRCQKARKKMRLEPKRTAEGFEVRIRGMRRSLLKRMEVTGSVEVPRDSPLFVDVGIGDVDIEAGDRGVWVKMGIGDLSVRAPESTVSSVSVRTRIGDASIRDASDDYHSRRKMLVGARANWSGGSGESDIRASLRIGDARVVLD